MQIGKAALRSKWDPHMPLCCLEIPEINTLVFRGKIKMDIRVSGYRRFWHIV